MAALRKSVSVSERPIWAQSCDDRVWPYADRPLSGAIAATTAAFLPSVEHRQVTASGSPLAPMLESARLYQQPLPNPFNYGWFSRIQDLASESGARKLLIAQTGNYSFSMSGYKRSPARATVRWMRSLLSSRMASARTDRFLRDRPAISLEGPAANNLSGADRRFHFLSRLNPGALLRGVQEHWGLELRDPFADRRLVEFSLRIPEDLLCGLGPRGIASKIAADLLPRELLADGRRGYQSADWIARLQVQHRDISQMVSACRDHAELRYILDLPALDRAAVRLGQLGVLSSDDERLYRIELPRALAMIAFVQSLER